MPSRTPDALTDLDAPRPGPGAPVAPAYPGLLRPGPRLIVLSALMLFLELALIRWTGSNVLYLSYFSNFVLLASFLGIGLGFLRARHPRDLYPWTPVALLVLVAFIRLFPVQLQNTGDQVLLLGGDITSSGPPRELVLTAIFVLTAATMAFVGEGVARTFALFRPLDAYGLDLIGSILGVLGFIALAFLGAPPVVWGVITAAGFAVTAWPERWDARVALNGAALAATVALLLAESLTPGAFWSPYYKVETEPTRTGEGGLFVRVNGVAHQAHLRASRNPIYTTVYERARPRSLDDVLVIGAGGGNDVAVALARGARRVDAVEIDPVLQRLGRDHHPDRPYSDPRVRVHIDDGRAFLERTDRRYDLINFALPDSLTLVQGQSALRLESYLFTREALEAVRDHLKPGGVFSMYNYYREDWLVARYARTLAEVFGRPPCVRSIGPKEAGRLAVLVTSVDPAAVRCPETDRVDLAGAPAPATDDHPFPYLRTRSLPPVYLAVIGLILAVSILAVRGVSGPLRPMASFLDLFFMGAAFLLLETKSIVQFALLFGTTWFVNALVFLGILASVLAAVALQRRVRLRRPQRLYVVLAVALLVAWLVPLRTLLALDPLPRFAVAVTLAFFPIFTANLVFTQRFRDTANSTTAFGANLLGAMFGGLLEYASLVVGFRALLVVVALLYGLAFAFGRRYLTGTPVEAPAVPAPVPAAAPSPAP
jgi:SAM-dependent methyltransferase